MGLLGVAETSAESASSVRLKGQHLLLGAGGGAGVVLAVIELWHGDPKVWADMLTHVGPWFLVVIIALWLFFAFAGETVDKVVQIGSRAVDEIHSQSASMDSVAVALKEMADKDDRLADESRRLAQYAAQQAERTYDRMTAQGEKIDLIYQALVKQKSQGE